jgi:hypothetical protein
MQFIKWLGMALISATLLAADAPQGTVPRATAEKYDAHAEQNGIAIGASLLKSSEARNATTAGISKCCLVVEVAVYPPKDGQAEVSLSDFGLRIAGQDTAIKPSSVEVIAGKLQGQPGPPRPDYDASTSSSISYGTGTDPATGRRSTSRTVSNGASVGIGSGDERGTKGSGSNEIDRHTLELELRARELPEGTTTAPVAGYLYFAVTKKKSAKYGLEYALGTNKTLTMGLK